MADRAASAPTSLPGLHPHVDRGAEALAGVSLTAGAGEFVALPGPSGCGWRPGRSLPRTRASSSMECQGIVNAREAAKYGIGAMRNARVRYLQAQRVGPGLYKPGEVDLAQAATRQFVNQGVGQDLNA